MADGLKRQGWLWFALAAGLPARIDPLRLIPEKYRPPEPEPEPPTEGESRRGWSMLFMGFMGAASPPDTGG
jgi:hypothetical protein